MNVRRFEGQRWVPVEEAALERHNLALENDRLRQALVTLNLDPSIILSPKAHAVIHKALNSDSQAPIPLDPSHPDAPDYARGDVGDYHDASAGGESDGN